MTDSLFEQLAAIEHERWADWQKYLHSKTEYSVISDSHFIPQVLFRQWERQIATSYADLSEEEKESDRVQVRRYWGLVASYAYDKSSNDAEFEPGHPVFELAEENDKLKVLVKELQEQLEGVSEFIS